MPSCSQSPKLGPGYRWDLFNGTVNRELAIAVKNEDTAKIYSIVKEGKGDVNLKEPKFGRTLLLLAVGNDKLQSTKALLKAGANLDIADFSGDQPIHEAVQYIKLKNNAFPILELLIKSGADVNALSTKGPHKVPLEGAVEDLQCAKLLLENGANAYYRNSDSAYVVWTNVLLNIDDNIEVARHMIIERKMPVPNPILFSYHDNVPRDIFDLLKLIDYSNNPTKQQTKVEIVNYLKKLNFPANQVYRGN